MICPRSYSKYGKARFQTGPIARPAARHHHDAVLPRWHLGLWLRQLGGWWCYYLDRQWRRKSGLFWRKVTSSVWDTLSLGTCRMSVRRYPPVGGYVTGKCRGKQGDMTTWEQTLSRWLSPRELSLRGRARQRKTCSQRRQDRGQRGSEKHRECGLPFPFPCPHLSEVGGAKENF